MSSDNPQPTILLALPTYDGKIGIDTYRSVQRACADPSRIVMRSVGGSLIPVTFGWPWCECLDGDYTHFAMLHADISTAAGWVDTLLAELDTHAADVVSAVVPIKGPAGLTSTAIGCGDSFDPVRRLTMREVYNLPETFTAADAGYPECPLLINTGCWVARVRDNPGGPIRLWAESFQGWQITSRFLRSETTGRRVVVTASEDWEFARHCHAAGAVVMATRKVQLAHEGRFNFGNDSPWGDMETDAHYQARCKEGLAII